MDEEKQKFMKAIAGNLGLGEYNIGEKIIQYVDIARGRIKFYEEVV